MIALTLLLTRLAEKSCMAGALDRADLAQQRITEITTH
jgi:hypothetical protein